MAQSSNSKNLKISLSSEETPKSENSDVEKGKLAELQQIVSKVKKVIDSHNFCTTGPVFHVRFDIAQPVPLDKELKFSRPQNDKESLPETVSVRSSQTKSTCNLDLKRNSEKKLQTAHKLDNKIPLKLQTQGFPAEKLLFEKKDISNLEKCTLSKCDPCENRSINKTDPRLNNRRYRHNLQYVCSVCFCPLKNNDLRPSNPNVPGVSIQSELSKRGSYFMPISTINENCHPLNCENSSKHFPASNKNFVSHGISGTSLTKLPTFCEKQTSSAIVHFESDVVQEANKPAAPTLSCQQLNDTRKCNAITTSTTTNNTNYKTVTCIVTTATSSLSTCQSEEDKTNSKLPWFSSWRVRRTESLNDQDNTKSHSITTKKPAVKKCSSYPSDVDHRAIFQGVQQNSTLAAESKAKNSGNSNFNQETTNKVLESPSNNINTSLLITNVEHDISDFENCLKWNVDVSDISDDDDFFAKEITGKQKFLHDSNQKTIATSTSTTKTSADFSGDGKMRTVMSTLTQSDKLYDTDFSVLKSSLEFQKRENRLGNTSTNEIKKANPKQLNRKKELPLSSVVSSKRLSPKQSVCGSKRKSPLPESTSLTDWTEDDLPSLNVKPTKRKKNLYKLKDKIIKKDNVSSLEKSTSSLKMLSLLNKKIKKENHFEAVNKKSADVDNLVKVTDLPKPTASSSTTNKVFTVTSTATSTTSSSTCPVTCSKSHLRNAPTDCSALAFSSKNKDLNINKPGILCNETENGFEDISSTNKKSPDRTSRFTNSSTSDICADFSSALSKTSPTTSNLPKLDKNVVEVGDVDMSSSVADRKLLETCLMDADVSSNETYSNQNNIEEQFFMYKNNAYHWPFSFPSLEEIEAMSDCSSVDGEFDESIQVCIEPLEQSGYVPKCFLYNSAQHTCCTCCAYFCCKAPWVSLSATPIGSGLVC